jgi:hypothetical protein
MPRNKDLKRLVRARMRKTGEAYTAARTRVITKPRQNDFAALAGMSDERVKAKTGCIWDRWVHALDRLGAEQMSHREIVALVSGKYKIDSWWSQTVTVGYERIKGLRARGQQRNGTHQMTKSRTYEVPVTTLFDAWSNARTRRRWLREDVRIRTSTAPKSMRLDWPDHGIVAVGFVAKGSGKSSVAIEHTKLPDRESALRLKAEWSRRFDLLGELLERA